MIFTPEPSSSSATCWALSAGTARTPTMMFFSRTTCGSVRMSVTDCEPIARPTRSGSLSKTAAILIPCSPEIGQLAIAWPRRPAPTSALCCCPCVSRSQTPFRKPSLCGLQPPPEARLVDVVREGLLALDLNDRDQLAVARLELRVSVDRDLLELELEIVPERAHLRERPLAEVTALGVVDGDLRDRGHV